MTQLVCIATFLNQNRVDCHRFQASGTSLRLRRMEAGVWFREDRNFVLRILRLGKFSAFVLYAPVGRPYVGRVAGTKYSSSSRARTTPPAISFESISIRVSRIRGLPSTRRTPLAFISCVGWTSLK